MTKSTLADVENLAWVHYVLMSPDVGHRATAEYLTFNDVPVSESSVRRWRKAHDYKAAVPTPAGLNTQPAEGSTDSMSDLHVVEYDGAPYLTAKDLVNFLLEIGDIFFTNGEDFTGKCFHDVAESVARPFMKAAVLATADADG